MSEDECSGFLDLDSALDILDCRDVDDESIVELGIESRSLPVRRYGGLVKVLINVQLVLLPMPSADSRVAEDQLG